MHDAIIVLGNLMDEFGHINGETQSRVSLACNLLLKNKAHYIVPCGWAYRDDNSLPIADAMASYAVCAFGVPKEKILTQTFSRDTVGDAIFTKQHLAVPRKWHDILVVTSDYHAKRTQEIFSFVYGRPIPVAPAPCDFTPETHVAEAKSIAAFRRTFAHISSADDDAIMERLRTCHPYYNGKVYPPI